MRHARTATANPVAAPPIVSVSQWACCQLRASIIASVRTAATGHQYRRRRAGTATTATTTTNAAILALWPEGNAQVAVSTMMSAGRGRSATCLIRSTAIEAAATAAHVKTAERQRRVRSRARTPSARTTSPALPPKRSNHTAACQAAPLSGPPTRPFHQSSRPCQGGPVGSARTQAASARTASGTRAARTRRVRERGKAFGVI
nr:hypothetical protein [Glycomyces paridis]